MNLPELPLDKANHALYGAAIFNVIFALVTFFHGPYPLYIALGVVALCAMLKEASDAWLNYRATGNPMTGPHGVEALDALATFGGGVLCALPLIVKASV